MFRCPVISWGGLLDGGIRLEPSQRRWHGHELGHGIGAKLAKPDAVQNPDASTRTHRMRILSPLAIREERDLAPVGMEVRGERIPTRRWAIGGASKELLQDCAPFRLDPPTRRRRSDRHPVQSAVVPCDDAARSACAGDASAPSRMSDMISAPRTRSSSQPNLCFRKCPSLSTRISVGVPCMP